MKKIILSIGFLAAFGSLKSYATIEILGMGMGTLTPLGGGYYNLTCPNGDNVCAYRNSDNPNHIFFNAYNCRGCEGDLGAPIEPPANVQQPTSMTVINVSGM